jgi:hypothetical protein
MRQKPWFALKYRRHSLDSKTEPPTFVLEARDPGQKSERYLFGSSRNQLTRARERVAMRDRRVGRELESITGTIQYV